MKLPRLKFHFFARQFLSHLFVIVLIFAIVSVGFRLYFEDHIYNTKSDELNSYANIIIRLVQKAEEPLPGLGGGNGQGPGPAAGSGGAVPAAPGVPGVPGGGGASPGGATPLQANAFQATLAERKISFVLMNENGDILLRDQRTLAGEFRRRSFLESLKSHMGPGADGTSFRIEKDTPDPLLVLPRSFKLRNQTLYLFVMSPEQGLYETLQQVSRTSLLLLVPALLLAVAVSLLLSGGMSRSVQKLREATRRIASGSYSARADVKRSDELGELARDFNSMAAQLEEASNKLAQYDINRRRFITDVTHELRTPLTSIRGIIEGLKNDFVPDPSERKRYYAIIEKETFRLIRLINELLDLERIENGLIELKYGTYPLYELLELVSESLEVLIEEKNLRLLIECPKEVAFHGDYDRIMQIVINLVKNSIQFTAHGTIRLIGLETEQHTVIEVADTGQGMSPDELTHIWERFFKADPSRAKQRSETGLGLSIVKRLVEAHRGTIDVVSEPGIGTTFTIRLPKPAVRSAASS
jgi:signal transduction histidine kinase